jgi:hypothetical protein
MAREPFQAFLITEAYAIRQQTNDSPVFSFPGFPHPLLALPYSVLSVSPW